VTRVVVRTVGTENAVEWSRRVTSLVDFELVDGKVVVRDNYRQRRERARSG
jgi:hypothetical protein